MDKALLNKIEPKLMRQAAADVVALADNKTVARIQDQLAVANLVQPTQAVVVAVAGTTVAAAQAKVALVLLLLGINTGIHTKTHFGGFFQF